MVLFLTSADASAANGGGSMLVMMIVLIAVFYFFMIRPENKRIVLFSYYLHVAKIFQYQY